MCSVPPFVSKLFDSLLLTLNSSTAKSTAELSSDSRRFLG